jgi:hypothetical protein
MLHLQEWPFVKVDPYMVCAHCIATSTNPPYLWRGEILDAKCPKGLYQTHCPKTSHEIPACLIYPIDSGKILSVFYVAFKKLTYRGYFYWWRPQRRPLKLVRSITQSL